MSRRRVAEGPVRSLRTRSGLRIRVSDDKDQPEITIEAPGGASPLTLRRLGKSVALRDADGNEISLKPGTLSIRAAGLLRMAAAKVEIDAGEVEGLRQACLASSSAQRA